MSEHGKLERAGDRFRLRYERHYPHPPEKVWRALIDPVELKHWFPTRIEGERKQGAKLRFVFEGENAPATEGTLTKLEPERLLEFSWGEDLLRFELSAHGSGTKLVFVSTFDERAVAPRSAAGWHACLDGLAKRLDGKPDGDEAPSWPRLYTEYVEKIGLGDFPAFIRDGGQPIENAMSTPGLRGFGFEGRNDTRIELLHASQDATTSEHEALPNEYLHVIAGSYELQLHGQTISLEAGAEFQLPGGSKIAGKISAGTRLLRARSSAT
jgi:uncharacterized protein YndB with AHSA1/START domain